MERVTMLVLALFVGLAGCASASTLPSQIFFSVTVRDFMAQVCRPGTNSGDVSTWCPTSLTTQISSGTVSGHPDFQRSGYASTPDLYSQRNAVCGRYFGKYAKFNQPFPVTFDSTPIGGSRTRPVVISDLTYDTAGIPKMQYCNSSNIEGYLCDYNDTAGRSVNNQQSFSTWHQDNTLYNIRAGFKLKLIKIPGAKYQYDSHDSAQDPRSPNFYSPFTDYNLGGWPLSAKEISLSGKNTAPATDPAVTGYYNFWHTTEIHTSFQYRGGEIFSFTGDDDVHVYVNNRLALNLGGLHGPTGQDLNVTKYERELGLVKGQIYQFDLFQAEREVTESNFKMETTLSEACNVINTDFKTNGKDVVNAIDWRQGGATRNSDWILIGGPNFPNFMGNGTIQLIQPGIQNVVSYMFYKQQQNTGSGFSLSFTFNATTGAGHGFAVLFHDRKLGLSDFNGGSGPNLGIKNTDNSFAVVFDMCPSFPDCTGTRSQIRMHYKADGDRLNSVSTSTRTVYDNNVVQNWRDGNAHSVEMFYYALPDWLEVYVDNSLRLVERGFSMSRVIGGKDAYVGFVTSTSATGSSQSVYISNVVMKTVKIINRFTNSMEDTSLFPKAFIANGRDSVSFTMQTNDACQNAITFGGSSQLVQAKMISTSVSDSPPSIGRRLQSTLVLQPEIIDLANGQYSVKFRTNVLANFSLYMAFGSNCTWTGTAYTSNTECWTVSYPNAASSIPFSTFAPTTEEAPSGLTGPALAGIGVAAGVIAVCGTIMIIVGVRIRNQWRRDKRFVEEGKRLVAERGVAYKGDNELDMLQNKLQITMHEIQAERARKLKAEDKQDVIDELLRQKGELQEMVRRLKIAQSGGDPNAPEERLTVGARVRKSFAASRVSRGASMFNAASGEATASNPLFDRLRKSISRPTAKSQAIVHGIAEGDGEKHGA